MTALERRGQRTFLMQGSDLRRLPWHRATYPANIIALRGGLRHAIGRSGKTSPAEFPDHAGVLRFLTRNEVPVSSLNAASLQRLARKLSATAVEFQRVLRAVKPRVAFTVTYYAGLGAAFLLACRRQGILSVDLQHCPQLGAHKAYEWSALPPNGYSTLPALFWNWTEQETVDIRRWTGALSSPWHRSLHGGHTQLAPFLSDDDPGTREWDRKFQVIGNDTSFERDILVALQPIPGHIETWNTLSEQIESGNPKWRWWIRRHPAAHPSQDLDIQRLLSLRRNNVVIDEASSFPLPALLRHMSVLVSLASGAAAEAAAFGVPAIFLSDEADATFFKLIRQGTARVADIRSLTSLIERLPRFPVRPPPKLQPKIDDTLSQVEAIAQEYARLCRDQRPGR